MSTASEETSKTSNSEKTKTTGFWPGCEAPTFHDVPCLKDGTSTTLTLGTLRGKSVILLFYPVDFCYIAPTELELLEQLGSECELVAISSGSLVSKQAFLNTPRYPDMSSSCTCHSRSEGGLQGLSVTLVEDRGSTIAQAYGVMREGCGYSFRALVLLDPQGSIVYRQVVDLALGLGLGEVARILRESGSTRPALIGLGELLEEERTRKLELVEEARQVGLGELLEEEERTRKLELVEEDIQALAFEEELKKFGLFGAKNVFQPVKDKIRSLLGYDEEPEEKKVIPAEGTEKNRKR